MKIKYRYGQPIAGRHMALENPGQSLLFDADRNLIVDVSAKHSIPSLLDSVRGKDEEGLERALADWGRAVMETTIDLADGTYMDRTGEMINKVAEQTGVSFPHRFQRYVELNVIASRSLDRWIVNRSTTSELWFQAFSCSIAKGLEEAGIEANGACKALCGAAFEAAAKKTGVAVRTEQRKYLPKDGVCHFCFAPA